MTKVNVNLKTVKEAAQFVSALNDEPGEFDLSCGQVVVDGKSILGVLSLDISRPLLLSIYEKEERILEKLNHFLIKD